MSLELKKRMEFRQRKVQWGIFSKEATPLLSFSEKERTKGSKKMKEGWKQKANGRGLERKDQKMLGVFLGFGGTFQLLSNLPSPYIRGYVSEFQVLNTSAHYGWPLSLLSTDYKYPFVYSTYTQAILTYFVTLK
jgi:hypothetical protein